MQDFKPKKHLFLGLAFSLFFGTACINNKEQGGIPNLDEEILVVESLPIVNPVFDEEKKVFNNLEGDINESVLNQSNNPNYKEETYLSYLQKVENREQSYSFRPLDENQGALSVIDMKLTAIENMYLIKKIDGTLDEEVEKQNLALKDLLNHLSGLHAHIAEDSNKVEFVKQMYDLIQQYLGKNRSTDKANGIENLLYSGGDCNDISATYFALLNYYGVKCYLRAGSLWKNEEQTGLHSWITVEIEDSQFDLDPTWYASFVPLEDRNSEINKTIFRDKYMKRKK